MPKRVAIPRPLTSRPFTVREALDAGLTPGRLEGKDLLIPHRGMRSWSPPASLVERCRELAPLLGPDQAFSHETAAAIWGIELPSALAEGPLHVTSRYPRMAPRRRGVHGHRISSPVTRLVVVADLPVVDIVTVWTQLAAALSVDELVAVGDQLVLDPVVLDPRRIRPYTTIEQLRERLDGFSGRGAAALSRALPLVRAGAESRTETLLRLLLLHAGLPEPEVNRDIRAQNGAFLGRADLVYPAFKVIVEYDGDHHRTSVRQYDADISRFDRFLAAGWIVIRVRSRGLFVQPGQTIARVTAALHSRGWVLPTG